MQVSRSIITAMRVTAIVVTVGLVGLHFMHFSEAAPAKKVETVEPVISHPDVHELFVDVNNERVKAGLAPLIEDARLDASAAAKCTDMVTMNYWGHNRPDGTEPWHFFAEQGITQLHLGENLAYGWPTSQSVVVGWMDSPSHKANILDPKYSDVGYAVCHSDNFAGYGAEDIVVQHFESL